MKARTLKDKQVFRRQWTTQILSATLDYMRVKLGMQKAWLGKNLGVAI